MRTLESRELQVVVRRTAPRTIAWASATLLLLSPVVVGRAAGVAPPGAESPGARLEAISTTSSTRAFAVLLELSEPVAYVTSEPDPLTVQLDLRNVSAAGVNGPAAGSRALGPIAAVTVDEQTAADGVAVSRVRVRLTDARPYRVRSARNVIRVEVDRAGTPAATTGSAGSGNAATAGAPARGPRQDADPIAAIIDAASRADPSQAAPPPAVPPQSPPPATPVTDPALSLKIPIPDSSWPEPPRAAPVEPPPANGAATAGKTGANATPTATVPAPGPARSRVTPPAAPVAVPAAPAGTATRGVAAALQQQQSPAPRPQPQSPPAQQSAPPAQQQQPPPTGAQQLPAPTGQRGQKQYTGHTISMDFGPGADLRAVLRTFAMEFGLNILVDPAVKGTVDVALRDVPWDQALDIILRSNQLGWSLDGNVIRIAPLTVLADEEAQRRKLAEEQALGGELEVMTRTLSYSKGEDMKALLLKALTKRGDVQVDPRTNTLIIRDLAVGLKTASELIDALDQPQPQVEIEARIVQTTRNFARQIGVQLGLLGRASAELGNTSSLAFPNQGSVSGRTGAVQGDASGSTPSVINMGVAGATSALGLTLGSVNGALNLDAVLSALEKTGQGRLLSTPRVVAQNNVAAEMTQGVQIPIQTVANNTVTVTFKDAALQLKVTPQINANGTVMLEILLENAAPDYTKQINNIPPIDTQRATTQILLKDGQTAVMGGIFVSREQAQTDRTPGLGKVPVLGWLFKRDTIDDETRELLIFITPRIIRM